MVRGNREITDSNSTMEDLATHMSTLITSITSIQEDLSTQLQIENERTRKFIKEENEETRSMLRELIEVIKDCSEQQRDVSIISSNKVCNKLEEIKLDIQDQLNNIFTKATNVTLEKEINKAKQSMKKLWEQKLSGRNDLFSRVYRNKRLSELFAKELEEKEPKIPRKFLPAYNVLEDEEEHKIKQELAKEKVKAEIRLQDIRSKRQITKISDIDTEIISFITKNNAKDVSARLIEMWQTECMDQENQAKNKFDAKEEWFLENWLIERNEETEKTSEKKETKENKNHFENKDHTTSRRDKEYPTNKQNNNNDNYFRKDNYSRYQPNNRRVDYRNRYRGNRHYEPRTYYTRTYYRNAKSENTENERKPTKECKNDKSNQDKIQNSAPTSRYKCDREENISPIRSDDTLVETLQAIMEGNVGTDLNTQEQNSFLVKSPPQ